MRQAQRAAGVLGLCVALVVIQACSSTKPLLKYDSRDATLGCDDIPSFDPTALRDEETILRDHVIRVNGDGVMVDPVLEGNGSSPPTGDGTAQRHIRRILCNAIELAKSKRRASGDTTEPLRVPVLVFVHGGLNSLKSTNKRLLNNGNVTSRIMCGSTDSACPPNMVTDASGEQHYPVFVSWPSDALGTWRDHTFRIREGNKVQRSMGLLSAPFILASDLLTTVGRYPATVAYQLTNEKDRAAAAVYPNWLSGSWKSAIARFCRPPESEPGDTESTPRTRELIEGYQDNCSDIPLPGPYNDASALKVEANLSIHEFSSYERWTRTPVTLLTFPFRYTVGSVWHSGVAVTAWENMKRRTMNLFYPAHFYDARFPEDVGAPGGLFFSMLFDYADAYADKNVQFEVTLVGHSMGAIVLNNTLDFFGTRLGKTPHLRNIVYMAAAASVRDTLSSVGPVLERATVEKHPINFYNLTLNRVSEVAERHVAGLIPTGSLLVSIDQHYDSPEHSLLRTMGSEINVLTALDTIDMRLNSSDGDLVFKAFDRNPGRPPESHGDFWELAFWKPCVWKLDAESESHSSLRRGQQLPSSKQTCQTEWRKPQ